ncbi:nucleotidyl transferase AbiEii/AbiGii toxin family protein [Amycolatopsis sp.]|uniref:nucleotidyl transferase AbiEii/AbiGii toxin family protein n=1 Tax=Amycolatopsis sp. TaxID=37632 RepID=UPI002C7442CE|nr:nucleotidyl transferase AbiEii/AbiGii toxin family protein [Amycolatopsis sp.]HVV12385.1 nucleotidyl transferase AbiEii/AbiGii toxin family protein [Amycolatopsis sp.]
MKDRAKNAAKITGIPASELVDLHFHRRLLARVFHAAPDFWVLKGGQALLMRWPTARYSTDIDLLSTQATTDAAVEDLIRAASTELDDSIRFEHHDTTAQTHVERPTRTVRFRAMLGNTVLKWVSVDVVVSDYQPRGAITTEPLEAPFATDCTTWPAVRIFPIEDHIAEKLCAMYERYRSTGNTSSRYKDLADLVLIALKSSVDGVRMHATLQHEIQRREKRGIKLVFPSTFDVPDSSWIAGYRNVAKDIRELPAEMMTLEGVRDFAGAFITPLLAASAPNGDWSSTHRKWC